MRTKRSGLQCNFYVWYEVDDEEEPTALRLEEYDGDDDCAWGAARGRRRRRVTLPVC